MLCRPDGRSFRCCTLHVCETCVAQFAQPLGREDAANAEALHQLLQFPLPGVCVRPADAHIENAANFDAGIPERRRQADVLSAKGQPVAETPLHAELSYFLTSGEL